MAFDPRFEEWSKFQGMGLAVWDKQSGLEGAFPDEMNQLSSGMGVDGKWLEDFLSCLSVMLC